LIGGFNTGLLSVRVYETRSAMGAEAAQMVAEKMRLLLDEQSEINMVFAAAPSQIELLNHLSGMNNLDWSRVNGFHMDEWLGMDKGMHSSFGFFLHEKIFGSLPYRSVNYLDGNTPDPIAECQRYARLLKANPADIVCLGIGENTHIAFNEPHAADFLDPQLVKMVDLDETCRHQQVHDGSFSKIAAVPLRALTLTVPALMSGRYLYCLVPGQTKAQAVYHTVHEEIQERYPSTILRTHPNAVLFLDPESSHMLTI
jgi:glucosamine-6-phosphate deaminase